jgi:hypothetical protein
MAKLNWSGSCRKAKWLRGPRGEAEQPVQNMRHANNKRPLVESVRLGRHQPRRGPVIIRRCAPQVGSMVGIAHAVVDYVRVGIILTLRVEAHDRAVIVGGASRPLLGSRLVGIVPSPFPDPVAFGLTEDNIGGTTRPVGRLAQQPLLARVAGGLWPPAGSGQRY